MAYVSFCFWLVFCAHPPWPLMILYCRDAVTKYDPLRKETPIYVRPHCHIGSERLSVTKEIKVSTKYVLN